jgi:hypothetical protein
MSMNRPLIALATLVLLSGRASAADAAKPGELDALRAEVKRLAAQVEALTTRPAAQPTTYTPPAAPPAVPTQLAALDDRVSLLEVKQGDSVVLGDIPGAFRVPGTDVSLRLYGFAELNWVHDFGADNSDIDYSTFAPYMPLDGTPEAARKNRDYLTGRTSRLGLEAATPTQYGVLGVKLEGDFNNEPRSGNSAVYGSAGNVFTQQSTNSYGFRIRHLYGQFGGLLVGQTWSTFMDVDNYPETVDFNGPIGATFIRQPQIRFAYPTSKGTFTAALENSSTYVLDDTGSAMSTSLSRLPDVVVRWDKGFDWGALSARAMTQELHVDDGAGAKATKRGYGAAASASFKLRGSDLLSMQVTGGEGLGRYFNYIEGAFYDGTAGEIRAERAMGVIAGYQYKPNSWVRANLVYGATRTFDNAYTDFAAANGLDSGRFGVNRWVQQAHAGPIFTPMKGVDLGLEGIWASRKTLAGESGDDFRVNFSAKYYIN